MGMYGKRALLRASGIVLSAAVLALIPCATVKAQGGGNAGDVASQTSRAATPKDLTGYWVSVVTELWRFRMVVPDKNDYPFVPLNPEGRKIANFWDPAKDQAAGVACKSYGAPAIMQVPGRLHIYWQNDSTLRIDTDSGTQTRLFHFGGSAPESSAPTWQGYSVASWQGDETVDARDGQGGPVLDKTGELVPGKVLKKADYLKVTTSRMRSGYLQKNGIPYSTQATLEEFYDTFTDPYSGSTWLTVTTVVTDPQYLIEPLFTHAHFKKIPDASGWDATSCQADKAR